MMRASEHQDDYWAEVPEKAELAPAPAFVIETIVGLEPLDRQFGVANPSRVPASLRDTLFGQPDPTPSEIAAEGGSSAVPSLNTYAILDAAKVPGLAEVLDATGLERDCLFQGQAAEEMRDAAPWLVRLEEEHSFTRDLFTEGEMPHHMWSRASAVFLRSRDNLGDLRAHLRKFVKVRDDSEAWFYLRFYDPRVMRPFLHTAPPLAHRFLTRSAPWSSLTVITCLDGTAEIVRPTAAADGAAICLGAAEKAVFRDMTFVARADGLMAKLDRGTAVAMPTDPALRQAHRATIVAALRRMHGYGFQQPAQQEKWAVWELFYGAGFERADRTLMQLCEVQTRSSGERFAAFQRRLEEMYP